MQLGGLTFPTANIVTDISKPNLYFGTLELSVGSMGQQGQSPCVTTISVPPWPQYMMRKPITSWYHSLLRALFKIQEIGLEAFILRVLKSGLGMTLHPSIISILQGGMANQIIMQYFWNFIGLFLFSLLHLETLIDIYRIQDNEAGWWANEDNNNNQGYICQYRGE